MAFFPYGSLDSPDVHLRLGDRFWRCRYDGDDLLVESGTSGGKPKVTRSTFPDEGQRSEALHKACEAQQKKGFAVIRPEGTAGPGEPVFQAFVGDRCDRFDVTGDGGRIVVGAHKRDARGYSLTQIDARTGERAVLVDTRRDDQTFLLSVRVADEGAALYALATSRAIEVHHVSVADAHDTIVTSATRDSNGFNPHCVPATKTGRHWLHVEGDQVQLRHPVTGVIVRAFSVGVGVARTCGSIALSPQGNEVALLVWPDGHPGKLHFYDVESGERRRSVVLPDAEPKPSWILDYFPEGSRLLLSSKYGRELFVFDPEASAFSTRRFMQHDYAGSLVPINVMSHAFTADAARLALGHRSPFIVKIDEWEGDTVVTEFESADIGSVIGMKFAAEGRLLVAGGDSQRVAIFKV